MMSVPKLEMSDIQATVLRPRPSPYKGEYLREQTSSRDEEELIAAKMVGRWHSGAPLVLTPEHDDPTLGAD